MASLGRGVRGRGLRGSGLLTEQGFAPDTVKLLCRDPLPGSTQAGKLRLAIHPDPSRLPEQGGCARCLLSRWHRVLVPSSQPRLWKEVVVPHSAACSRSQQAPS